MPLIKCNATEMSFGEYYEMVGNPSMMAVIDKLNSFFTHSEIIGLISINHLLLFTPEDDFIRIIYFGSDFKIVQYADDSRITDTFENLETGFKALLQKMAEKEAWKNLPEFK